MELHSKGWMLAMFQSHDLALGRCCRHFKFLGNRIEDNQRVIAHGFERRRNPLEYAFLIMIHRRCFSMHHMRGAIHLSAVDGSETLVAETNSEDGNPAGEVTHGVGRDAAIFDGFSGAGRDDKLRWVEFDQVFNVNLIVTKDLHIGAEFAKILNKIISEGVVVIY